MIDTIKVRLKSSDFIINKYEDFKTSEKYVYSNKVKYGKWYFNLKNGLSLELCKQRGNFYLYITINSCPTFLFGNNIDELMECDFDPLVEKVCYELKKYNIVIIEDRLKYANVVRCDIAKNIILNKYSAENAIRCFSKTFINYMDMEERIFVNKGMALYFKNNSHMICLYDKFNHYKYKIENKNICSEINNSLIKQMENDYGSILRIEVRLLEEEKIKSFLDNEKSYFYKVFNTTFWK